MKTQLVWVVLILTKKNKGIGTDKLDELCDVFNLKNLEAGGMLYERPEISN